MVCSRSIKKSLILCAAQYTPPSKHAGVMPPPAIRRTATEQQSRVQPRAQSASARRTRSKFFITHRDAGDGAALRWNHDARRILRPLPQACAADGGKLLLFISDAAAR